MDKPEDMFPFFESLQQKKPPSPGMDFGTTKAKSNFFNSSTKGINVMHNRFSQPTVNIANDPSDVEERIRAAVVMKRVRIEEFFRDFDKLRKGKVTAPQFRSILSMLNFNLTEEEFDALELKYRTPDSMVNYFAFCDTINLAFTVKGIEKDPSVRVAPVLTSDTDKARRKTLEFSPEDQHHMLQVIEEYRKAINLKRLNLKPMFQDFDITKSGHVTKN